MKKIICLSIAMYCALCLTFAQVKTEKNLETFSKLVAFGDIRVSLYSGNEEKIVVEAPSKEYIESLEIKNEKGELKLSTVKEVFKDAKSVKISIYYKKLIDIQAFGSAALLVEDTIKGNSVVLKASSGGQILAEVKLDVLDIMVGQGSIITLGGAVDRLNASVSSGGTLSAFALTSKNAYLEALTGGKIKVNVNDLLDANASMGGYIGYLGKPEKIKTKTSFKGTIEEALEPSDD
jgi:hypothetical protein